MLPPKIVLTKKYDVIVASSGGVGTTFFMKFLEKHIRVNSCFDRDKIKHTLYPPLSLTPNLKAIYIFGDPLEATISLFRREYHAIHMKKLQSQTSAPSFFSISSETTLEDYANFETDCFGLENHFHQWHSADIGYPVLFVKYDKVWERLDDIFNFIGLPSTLIDEFPKRRKRKSSADDISLPIREKLMETYSRFSNVINSLPDVEIHPSSPISYLCQLSHIPGTLSITGQPIHPKLVAESFFPETYHTARQFIKRIDYT